MKLYYYLTILFLLVGCTHKVKEGPRIEEKSQKREEITLNNLTEERDIDADILMAEEYISSERFYDAIKLLEELKKLDPENANIYYLLGRAYEEVGMDELSVNAYMKAISLDPDIGNNVKIRGQN